MSQSISTARLQDAAVNGARNGVQAPDEGVRSPNCQRDTLTLSHAAGNHAVGTLLELGNTGTSLRSRGAPHFVEELLCLPGRPLDPDTRLFAETRFGYDFDSVRIHDTGRAAESAIRVNATAFTVGNDIVFGHGEYAPQTSSGLRLLTHELAHVVQQSRGGQYPPNPLPTSNMERSADQAAASALSSAGGPVQIPGACAQGLARLHHPTDTMDDCELELEIEWIRQHMANNPNDPENGRLRERMLELEDEVFARSSGLESPDIQEAPSSEARIPPSYDKLGEPGWTLLSPPGQPTTVSPQVRPRVGSGKIGGLTLTTQGRARATNALSRPERELPSSLVVPQAPPSRSLGKLGDPTLTLHEHRGTTPTSTTRTAGSVLVLGRYERPFAAAGGRQLPVAELLQNDAQRATGLRARMLGGMTSFSETFPQLVPSASASAAVVQEALEGGTVTAIYLDTRDVDFYRGGSLHRADALGHQPGSGAHTAAEYRNVVVALAAGNHRVDVYLRHEGGLSVIRAGQQVVEGAPLPDFLRRHLPPSFFRPTGGTPGRPPTTMVPSQPGRPPGDRPEVNASPNRSMSPASTQPTGAQGRSPGGVVPRGGILSSRAAGASVGVAAMGLDLLAGYLRGRAFQRQIERSVQEMEPEIEARLDRLQPAIEELRATALSSARLYANITIRVHLQRVIGGTDPELGQGPDIVYCGTSLEAVDVSLQNLQDSYPLFFFDVPGWTYGMWWTDFGERITYSIPLAR